MRLKVIFAADWTTELCRKPRPRELRTIVHRAQAVRARYLEARSAGTIVMEDDSCEV
jgi:hypothetical protein